jgi:hypothetical protein
VFVIGFAAARMRKARRAGAIRLNEVESAPIVKDYATRY